MSVSLNVSLSAPVSPYGDIVVYQVVVLREPALAGEDPLTLNLLKETELQVWCLCVCVCVGGGGGGGGGRYAPGENFEKWRKTNSIKTCATLLPCMTVGLSFAVVCPAIM